MSTAENVDKNPKPGPLRKLLQRNTSSMIELQPVNEDTRRRDSLNCNWRVPVTDVQLEGYDDSIPPTPIPPGQRYKNLPVMLSIVGF